MRQILSGLSHYLDESACAYLCCANWPPIVRDLHHCQSGGKTADEQEPPAQKLDIDPRENGNDRVEKHEKATESNEDCGPDGNCPRSPKRNPNQCRAEDGADNKHRVVIAHDPIVIKLLCYRHE